MTEQPETPPDNHQAEGPKGCIGCLVDGYEHTCGYVALPYVPLRWRKK